MNLEQALKIISQNLGATYDELIDGLPEGSDSEWGFDEQLVIEIGQAVERWSDRQPKFKDPYNLSFFDGTNWSVIKRGLQYSDIYREWFNLTKGGKFQNNITCETYYYMGKSNEILNGRHKKDEEI